MFSKNSFSAIIELMFIVFILRVKTWAETFSSKHYSDYKWSTQRKLLRIILKHMQSFCMYIWMFLKFLWILLVSFSSLIQHWKDASRATGIVWQVWTSATTWSRLVTVTNLFSFNFLCCIFLWSSTKHPLISPSCAGSFHSHQLFGLLRYDMEHKISDASLSF